MAQNWYIYYFCMFYLVHFVCKPIQFLLMYQTPHNVFSPCHGYHYSCEEDCTALTLELTALTPCHPRASFSIPGTEAGNQSKVFCPACSRTSSRPWGRAARPHWVLLSTSSADTQFCRKFIGEVQTSPYIYLVSGLISKKQMHNVSAWLYLLFFPESLLLLGYWEIHLQTSD